MKYCIECGCLIPDSHVGNMCEVCQEERDGTISDSLREENNTYNEFRSVS